MNSESTAIGLIAVFSFVEPHAAIGALAGMCFFLAMPHVLEWWRVVLLSVSSAMMGYGAGVSEWSADNAMIVSSVASALGVALLTGLNGVIKDRVMDVINILLPWRR